MEFPEASGWLKTPPQRVAVLRALALGDLLCAVPTLRALRHAWPDTEVTLIGLPWAREFAARFAMYFDRFVEFPGWPGLPEREPLIDRIPDFMRDMQRERFDLAIQLHGSGTVVNSLVVLWGARHTAGFCPPDYYCPDATTFAPWPEHGLEIHRLLSLVDFLGLPRCGDELELPLSAADYSQLTELIQPAQLMAGRYVVIHPGASVDARRWPAEQFAAVGDALADDGYDIVLTGVSGERALSQRVAGAMHNRVIDLCGQSDLGTLGVIIANAALVVCNDTGVSHVAAAVKTPSVVISTGENPQRWSPTNRQLHRVLCRDQGVEVNDVQSIAIHLIRSVRYGSRLESLRGRELVTA